MGFSTTSLCDDKGLNVVVYVLGIIFAVWVIYLGGAERLENTFLGYLEFGTFAYKTSFIKFSAWIGLLLCIGLLVSEVMG